MYLRMRFHLSTAMAPAMERPFVPGLAARDEFSEPAGDYGVPVPRGSGAAAGTEETGLAAGSVVVDRCLSRTSVAAYLLGGGAAGAESLPPEGPRRLPIDAIRDGWVSWKAVPAAVPGKLDSQPPSPGSPEFLPVELQRVLRLSTRLRQCFVLRFLMAMPRQYCAGLLHIDAEEVDANCSLAAQDLARMEWKAAD